MKGHSWAWRYCGACEVFWKGDYASKCWLCGERGVYDSTGPRLHGAANGPVYSDKPLLTGERP